jgi:hypothetical protein
MLNYDKTHKMFSVRHSLKDNDLQGSKNNDLNIVECIKLLGIYVDRNLKWNAHIAHM